ncbi:hypothetical protein [Psychrosphaera aestuarii]|uniref:hypothetical protein n=1 Tax=Psychrosphaera aestuarii TaxID=1266052 RepID=UPI001B342EDC|nr:hypothetical protein [Psychrosphaera aestuarii]
MENQKNDVKGALKASRRQLLIKSAKVAPVITAIAAAPVWATGNANSSHQSAGMSSTSRITRFNGFSPGYFHEHKNDKNKGPKRSSSSARVTSNDNECQTSKGGSKLPDFYYDKFYGGIGGIFPGSLLAAQVRDVLSPSNWTKGGETANINGHSVTQVDRFMLTAYLNADPLYGASGYPYTQEEIRNFCRDYEQGRVSYTDAKLILTNLIHEGQEDMSWEADTVC